MRLNEESCPVSESVLGNLYRASSAGLPALVQAIPVSTRAILAGYCYRRAHLMSVALAIASSCEKHDLVEAHGELGAVMHELSQNPKPVVAVPDARRKVSLSTGPIMHVVVDQDLV
jgi:hypothetical protein